MGRDINPVIFKNWKAFWEFFFIEVNFWPLILDTSWVSGGMIAFFWRKMLFLFHLYCFQWESMVLFTPRSPDMNAAIWFIPSFMPFHSLQQGEYRC